ncbi:MAG TPA: galactose-1-epimerase [Providencia sp.]|uniref:galactose-1-epimerase n=1 Tax=Providencia sp. TaxID=589 RepID=UPI000E7D5958|nr:galactose-1-epimerase [Providencia sp.]HBO24856.1 galactose-1-epimerase [Providencia sp.]
MQFTKEQRHTLKTPKVIALANQHGMKIILTSLGAGWVSCILPLSTGKRDVVLGSPNMSAQMEQGVYLGSTVGRVANRIANAKFILDNNEYSVINNQGVHCLHGGKDNFSHRVWSITQPDQQQAVFTLVSPDGDQGFPGELKVEVRYELTDDNQVIISYKYQVDKGCPVNLTNHTYFNLAGENSAKTALEHDLQIHGTHFLPTDNEGIPTGEWRDVTDTHFDFRQGKRIGRDFLQDDEQRTVGGYDHTFILDSTLTDGKEAVASLISPDGDVRMNVTTTRPAMQLYTGNYLIAVSGKSQVYTPFSGVAFETQFPPDAINHPEWGEQYRGIAEPNNIYTSQTSYQFIF